MEKYEGSSRAKTEQRMEKSSSFHMYLYKNNFSSNSVFIFYFPLVFYTSMLNKEDGNQFPRTRTS
jgi:hypothetical protein